MKLPAITKIDWENRTVTIEDVECSDPPTSAEPLCVFYDAATGIPVAVYPARSIQPSGSEGWIENLTIPPELDEPK